MTKHALTGALLGLSALALSACGSSDAAPPPPPGAVAAAGAPGGAAPAAPAVTVASCTAVDASGTLCIEFSQAHLATLGATGAQSLCTGQLSATLQTGVPCSPFDRLGACELETHVLYGYKAGGASENDYRRLCAMTAGRFMAGGSMAEPGPDAVHPAPGATLTVGQAVLYLCSDRCTATRIGRVVDVLPDGRVTVEDQGDRDTVARDHVWVGSYSPVPNGLGNSEADDFPTITEAPLPAGTEVWAKDTWWYRGRVVEDTGGDRLRIDFLAYTTEPQEISRRNVRLHR